MSTTPPSSSPAPSAPPPEKKRRSPVERVIVQGGILLLLLLVAVQAHARFGYELTLKNLQNRLAAEENGTEEGNPLYVNDVPTLIVGWPSRSVVTDKKWEAVTYSWRGLTKTYSIRMPYDTSEERPAVLSLETAEPPPVAELPDTAGEQPEAAPDLEQFAGRSGGMGGPGGGMHGGGSHGGPGGGGPGGGRGGPPPDIMASDADGDGKVSKEEAPERMAAFFDRIDTNSDGFIDADEVAEMLRRRAERQAAGEAGGEGRPQRPAAEEAAPASTDAPADAAAPAQKSDSNE